MKRLLILLLAIAGMALLLTSCEKPQNPSSGGENGNNNKTVSVTKVTLNKESITLKKGDSETLVATVMPDNASNKTVSWSSSDAFVASVDNSGKVIAKNGGTAIITAKAGEKSATCKISVSDNITFADARVKVKLLEAFDTDHDGELSFAEAAAVTSIEGVFGKEKTYTSFDEFQYFTGVTNVPRGMFSGWHLTSITLPESILVIWQSAFSYCKLKTLAIPSKVTVIEEGAFKGSSISSIVIPNGVTEIAYECFAYCEALTSISLPESVSKIQGMAFNGCTSLQSIKLPDSLKEIGSNSFHGSGLKSIEIPKNVERIGQEAYVYNKNLQYVILYPTTPPTVYKDSFSELDSSLYPLATYPLFVPDESVDAYKKAGVWRNYYVKRIFPISDVGSVPVSSVELNKTSINMPEGDTETLTATVKPDNATKKTVTWSSSNASIASVDQSGKVCALKEGSATISASAGVATATCVVTIVKKENTNAVDLGLSVKWASSNIGASKPEDYGDYYAWGEIEKKSLYYWSNYKWCDERSDRLIKYNTKQSRGLVVDNKAELDESDDIAHLKLGGKWRMPSKKELEELRDNCVWTWIAQNGVNGYKVASKTNNNSIFLPAGGSKDGDNFYHAEQGGSYWSSSLNSDEPMWAWKMNISSMGFDVGKAGDRCLGYTIRPVTE